ncbi:hypothetical protein [Pedobacter sp. GR22-10]|uniref:hypothetical protein n=1 Tax=Pedobacter sp. GR22-10 TaxID=2994472 RepID=UPI002247E811|nr:hypothetical protein [Pedobacter sp. GR22-10]MCX2430644.1 hypothetical protein [Pedobacter sp. GR22-10]
MPDRTIPSTNFFHLPFTPNTKILTENTLNQYSEIRKPKRGYFPIKVRKISFSNELLVIGVILDKEPEEMVYIKVTASELLISCSVDTHENYLSRYAYFSLAQLMYYDTKYDFEDYYWPDFFDQKTGESKYLMIHKSKDNLHVSSKVRYTGFYKPKKQLPVITQNPVPLRKVVPCIQEQPPKETHVILGFCLADSNNEWYRTNHYPFLVPYTGILNKAKTELRSFTIYVLNETQLPETDLTDEQQKLVEICFDMRKIALVASPAYKDDASKLAEKREQNQYNFNELFELWQKALPLLSGRLYTHYNYTYGMRNVKGKPRRSSMIACSFDSETPEICFLWKDKGDYYKLELRLRLSGKIHQLQYNYNTAFFAMLFYNPRRYALLNSVIDSKLLSFFQKSHFQLLVLKKHYDGDFKEFVDRLRMIYVFISQ